jgi:hypothetical protein
MRKFSESNFSISIQVHSSNNSCDISLLNILFEFGEKFAERLEIYVAMLVLVNNREGCYCAEIHLSFKSLFFMLNFQMIVNFLFKQSREFIL